MYKVLLLEGGKMGKIARDVLEARDDIELVKDDGYQRWDILFSASHPSKVPWGLCQLAALGAVNIHIF